SFGGIALSVGMIVDSSIVVLENIVRQRQRGADRQASALVGAGQVTGAIIASTLTTCVIFLPVVFMASTTAMLFRELALVVVFALLCSLFIALTLVPMLASRFLTILPDVENARRRGRFAALERRYARLIEYALDHRAAVVLGALGLVALAAAAVPLIPFELAPQTDGDQLEVRMRMDDGTNIAVMYEYSRLLDAAVRDVVPPEEVVFITNDVRNNNASVQLALKPPGERSIGSRELADMIRNEIENTIPGADINVQAESGLWILRRLFRSGGGGGQGESLQLEVRGYDLRVAEDVIERLVNRIAAVPGVTDGDASNRERRPEQNVVFDRARIAELGVGVQDIASAIQTSIGGRRAGVFRVAGEEIPITVRLRPEDRMSALDIGNIS